jgi:hypothetical protein
MNIKHCLFLLVIIAFSFSCQRDEEPLNVSEPTAATSTKNYPGVNRELWLYFQRFEAEAAKRNVKVDLVGAKITGAIDEIAAENVLGQCNFRQNHAHHLIIDKTFWTAASDRFREFVVFHELGHCALLRDHREDKLPTGACASLMRSGTLDCRDNYNATTRTLYLDELYDKAYFGSIFH